MSCWLLTIMLAFNSEGNEGHGMVLSASGCCVENRLWGGVGGEGGGRWITALVQRGEGAIIVCPGWGQLVEGGEGLNIVFLLFHLIFSLKLYYVGILV